MSRVVWAARLAPYFRQAAALGVLVLAARSAYSVSRAAVDHFGRAPAERSASNASDRAPEGSASATPSAPEEPGAVLPISGLRTAKNAGAVHGRRLVVDVGMDRSEVYVDGRRVGQVPYVGEWACASGDLLEITLVPPSGVPADYRVPCRGEDITVRSDQAVQPLDGPRE